MDQGYRIDTEKLKTAREEAGLSLAGLALKTGMDAYHLALVEQQLYVPTLTSLRSITSTLGLPTHTVIEWRSGAFVRQEPESPA